MPAAKPVAGMLFSFSTHRLHHHAAHRAAGEDVTV